MKRKILIVDGHSMIFAWPELSAKAARRGASAREALIRALTSLQDGSEWSVAIVFDGKGAKATAGEETTAIKVFYSKSGQTADEIIERLAAKYAPDHEVTVATNDRLERLTVESFGATSISSRQLLDEIGSASHSVQQTLARLRAPRKRSINKSDDRHFY